MTPIKFQQLKTLANKNESLAEVSGEVFHEYLDKLLEPITGSHIDFIKNETGDHLGMCSSYIATKSRRLIGQIYSGNLQSEKIYLIERT